MKYECIASAMALALLSTPVWAETSVSTESSTSVTTSQGATKYSTTENEQSVDIDGTVTEQTHSYEIDPDAASSSATVTTVDPDGARTTVKKEHSLKTEDGKLVEKETTTESRVQ